MNTNFYCKSLNKFIYNAPSVAAGDDASKKHRRLPNALAPVAVCLLDNAPLVGVSPLDGAIRPCV